MPEVRIALGTGHLDALHAMAEVLPLADHPGGQGLKIAGPATAGVILGRRVEQRGATTGAVVDARHLAVVVLTAEGALGTSQPADMELGLGELVAPRFQGFFDLFHRVHLKGGKKPGLHLSRAPGRTYHACLSERQSFCRILAGKDDFSLRRQRHLHIRDTASCRSANRTSSPTSATTSAGPCSSTPNAWRRKATASSS